MKIKCQVILVGYCRIQRIQVRKIDECMQTIEWVVTACFVGNAIPVLLWARDCSEFIVRLHDHSIIILSGQTSERLNCKRYPVDAHKLQLQITIQEFQKSWL